MSRRHSLNYIYFGALFVLLALLHVFHVNLVEQGTSLNRLFYTIYAIGQCLFEVAALILIGAWASEKFPAFAKGIFVTFTFVLFLMHLIDFPLMRIMDMSIWYSFSIVFAESFENFIELLKASNIQMVTWLLMGAGAAFMVIVGIFLFRISNRLSSKKPFYFSYKAASLFIFSVLCILTLFDHQTASIASATKDAPFLKALPWKTTLLTNSYPKWNLQASLPPKPTQAWYQDKLESLDATPLHKPNIYLFIAESIREDFITDEIAPALSQFRNEGVSFPQAISGANATPLSWFSIFHGIYPFSWEDRQLKNWRMGSLPLQLLKKAGYQIHVLSASRLNYYQMDQILFGKDKMLADDFQVFADDEHETYVFDTKCIDQLIQKMNSAEEGHLFIVFLEGTHFDYSWPKHLSLPSRPFSKAIDYLRLTYSKGDLEGIKNRYRHAIYHIDEQFNRFLTALKSHPRQDEAVVVFTSDHGEEFFEEGRIFHASNLNRAQTRIPLYYRLPHQKTTSIPHVIEKERIWQGGARNLSQAEPTPKQPNLNRLGDAGGSQTPWLPGDAKTLLFTDVRYNLTSHLDIFPTLLDHVFGNVQPWFDGESILRKRQKPFAISTRFNASRAPYEFLVTTEDELLVSRFDIRADIRQSKNLEIISRKDQDGQLLDTSSDQANEKYQEILRFLFSQH